jgi:hypothetical protein
VKLASRLLQLLAGVKEHKGVQVPLAAGNTLGLLEGRSALSDGGLLLVAANTAAWLKAPVTLLLVAATAAELPAVPDLLLLMAGRVPLAVLFVSGTTLRPSAVAEGPTGAAAVRLEMSDAAKLLALRMQTGLAFLTLEEVSSSHPCCSLPALFMCCKLPEGAAAAPSGSARLRELLAL